MPVTSIVFVAAVVIAFSVLAIALAWGAHQTALADREQNHRK
jgi:hypothetical protein